MFGFVKWEMVLNIPEMLKRRQNMANRLWVSSKTFQKSNFQSCPTKRHLKANKSLPTLPFSSFYNLQKFQVCCPNIGSLYFVIKKNNIMHLLQLVEYKLKKKNISSAVIKFCFEFLLNCYEE